MAHHQCVVYSRLLQVLKTCTKDHFLWTRLFMVSGGQYITCACAHNRPTFARGSGPGLGFIVAASKTVHFATANVHVPDQMAQGQDYDNGVFTANSCIQLHMYVHLFITLLHSLAT